jgi:hypothetical protein
MSEILNHKEVYKDDEFGALIVHYFLDRIWIHADLYTEVTPKLLRKAWDVLDALEDNLKSRGVKCYYTCIDTADRAKFAHNFGFNATDELLNLDGHEFEIMSKEL